MYRLQYYISEMYFANVELEAHGQQVDWLGDNSSASNAAARQRNIRHNGLNDAWVDATRAGLGSHSSLAGQEGLPL